MYVRHPELSAAKENRDYIFRQVCEAVNTISDVAQGKSTSGALGQPPYDGPGELAAALDEFDVSIQNEFCVFKVVGPILMVKKKFYLHLYLLYEKILYSNPNLTNSK